VTLHMPTLSEGYRNDVLNVVREVSRSMYGNNDAMHDMVEPYQATHLREEKQRMGDVFDYHHDINGLQRALTQAEAMVHAGQAGGVNVTDWTEWVATLKDAISSRQSDRLSGRPAAPPRSTSMPTAEITTGARGQPLLIVTVNGKRGTFEYIKAGADSGRKRLDRTHDGATMVRTHGENKTYEQLGKELETIGFAWVDCAPVRSTAELAELRAEDDAADRALAPTPAAPSDDDMMAKLERLLSSKVGQDIIGKAFS
jgi:hypothetical protein